VRPPFCAVCTELGNARWKDLACLCLEAPPPERCTGSPVASETSPLKLAHELQPAPWSLLSTMTCMQDASKMHAKLAFASWPPFKSAIYRARCISSCSYGHGVLTAV